MMIWNAGKYGVNSAITGVANPKGAAIQSATFDFVLSVSVEIGTIVGLNAGLNFTDILFRQEPQELNSVLAATALGGVVTIGSTIACALSSTAIGLVAGTVFGKKAAEKSGNPITYKQVALLTGLSIAQSFAWSAIIKP